MPAQPELGSEIAQIAENLLWQMKRFEEAIAHLLKTQVAPCRQPPR